MLSDTLIDSQQYTVRIRERGQMTIPRKLRDELLIKNGAMFTIAQIGDGFYVSPKLIKGAELTDKFARLMEEQGITLADLLEDLPKIREKIYQEKYGKDAS
jgi:bifunctional DNA-binding transcriptional regulator/antitoxin component of YhaV-PrlF toxin-antitoxin module